MWKALFYLIGASNWFGDEPSQHPEKINPYLYSGKNGMERCKAHKKLWLCQECGN